MVSKTLALKRKSDLAKRLYKRGLYGEALIVYEDILDEHPKHIPALDGLRRVAQKEGRYSDALTYAEAILSLAPSPTSDHYLDIGYALNKLRRVEDAITAYQHALQLAPTSARAYHKLAHVYRANGRFSEAEAAYEKVFELDPGRVNSYYPYSNIHTFSPGDPAISNVETLLNDQEMQGHRRIRLLFTMGKIQNDLGKYKEAFSYYKQANDLVLQEEPFDAQSHTDELNHLIKTCTDRKELPKKYQVDLAHTPLFIIGMSRSGKSLTEWMLSEHPEIASGGEGEEWYTAIDQVFPPASREEWLGETLKHLSNAQKSQIAKHFQKLTDAECLQAPYIIHSMPFGYWHVGLLCEIFPQAKIIHCVRDPMDNIWTSYCKYYQSKNGYSYDLKRLVSFIKAYLSVMEHWKVLYRDRILTVQYEELCTQPGPIIKELLDFCGVSSTLPPKLQPTAQFIGNHREYREYIEEEVGIDPFGEGESKEVLKAKDL